MSDSIAILLAAGDLWEIIIGAAFFIMWTIAQLLGSRQEAKAKKKQRPNPQQPQPVEMAEGAPRPPQGAGPRKQEDALRSEVEEFLRRAQGRSQQSPSQPAERKKPPAKRQPERPQRKSSRPAATTQKAVPTLRTEGVAEHVQRHLSTDDIELHVETLGADVAQADDRLESRLHNKFDHDLGSLQHRESPETKSEETADLTTDIAAMLRSPQGMRQLIIANEVLRRPDW